MKCNYKLKKKTGNAQFPGHCTCYRTRDLPKGTPSSLIKNIPSTCDPLERDISPPDKRLHRSVTHTEVWTRRLRALIPSMLLSQHSIDQLILSYLLPIIYTLSQTHTHTHTHNDNNTIMLLLYKRSVCPVPSLSPQWSSYQTPTKDPPQRKVLAKSMSLKWAGTCNYSFRVIEDCSTGERTLSQHSRAKKTCCDYYIIIQ